MTRLSTLIAAAAFATFGLAAQASVPPSATQAADAAASTLAMGPGPWCGAPQDRKQDTSGKTGACEKVARNSRAAW